MNTHLCITVRWLADRYHGFTEDKRQPEWPPSPFRLFQALVSGSYQHGVYQRCLTAIKWLERQPAPEILALEKPLQGNGFDHFVPDNDNLLDHKKPVVRIIKPVLLDDQAIVHFVWKIIESDPPPFERLDELSSTLSTFGCGVDQAYAQVRQARIEECDAALAAVGALHRFSPLGISQSTKGTLRVPKTGTLDNLHRVFQQNRTSSRVLSERRKKRWPKIFDRIVYAGMEQPVAPPRPYRVFEIEFDDEERRFSYPQSKLIHIAGMVRHLAIEFMRDNPPRDLRGRAKDEWLRAYVSGHQSKEDKDAGAEHTQFSYVPLQTVNPHNDLADPSVRRVMIVAPVGDDLWLDHLARQLHRKSLKPDPRFPDVKVPPGTRLDLLADRKPDGVCDAYTKPSCWWASTTPVILNRYVEKKRQTLPGGRIVNVLDRGEINRQIELVLQQSGIDQPCEFEWSAFSYFRKMLSAHKYRRDPGNPERKFEIGYVRPSHLVGRTAIHVQIRFGHRETLDDANSPWIPAVHPVPGPLVIGSGRHCGFGVLAAVSNS